MNRTYYVYLLTSRTGTLYIGVTNNLQRRVLEHRSGTDRGFTARYTVDRLIYYETFTQILDAISREKQLKGWKRTKKLALARQANPPLRELAIFPAPPTALSS